MGHTPGPWTPHGWGDNDYEINAAEGTVCNVPGFDEDTVDCNMAEHNARLISAAPDLLAVCQAIASDLSSFQFTDGEYRLSQQSAGVILQSLREVIAKAEGRSE